MYQMCQEKCFGVCFLSGTIFFLPTRSRAPPFGAPPPSISTRQSLQPAAKKEEFYSNDERGQSTELVCPLGERLWRRRSAVSNWRGSRGTEEVRRSQRRQPLQKVDVDRSRPLPGRRSRTWPEAPVVVMDRIPPRFVLVANPRPRRLFVFLQVESNG